MQICVFPIVSMQYMSSTLGKGYETQGDPDWGWNFFSSLTKFHGLAPVCRCSSHSSLDVQSKAPWKASLAARKSENWVQVFMKIWKNWKSWKKNWKSHRGIFVLSQVLSLLNTYFISNCCFSYQLNFWISLAADWMGMNDEQSPKSVPEN